MGGASEHTDLDAESEPQVSDAGGSRCPYMAIFIIHWWLDTLNNRLDA